MVGNTHKVLIPAFFPFTGVRRKSLISGETLFTHKSIPAQIMKTPAMACMAYRHIQEGRINEPHLVDVVQFFFAITARYEDLEREITKIIANLPSYLPQQIADECTRIREQKTSLAAMDEQMFAIIELAGNEIAQNPMVDEYRVAFARTNIACNSLYQKLLTVRSTLQGAGKREENKF